MGSLAEVTFPPLPQPKLVFDLVTQTDAGLWLVGIAYLITVSVRLLFQCQGVPVKMTYRTSLHPG